MSNTDAVKTSTAKTVDLNADMGESFGPWTMGDDTALLDIVTSANIACGFHAGDADVMAATMALARDNGVWCATNWARHAAWRQRRAPRCGI